MGIKKTEQTSLADALLTRGQQRVLGILFGQPDRSFPAMEVIALAGVGTGAVHRELSRLAQSGVVTVTPVGRQRRYQANRECPVFSELHGLIVKTVGLAEPLRRSLAALGGQIRAAFVYGSIARGSDSARSDIDLMIVSEDLSHAEVYTALAGAEKILARPVNPTLISLAEWQHREDDHNHFLVSVSKQPKLFIIGSEDDLG